MTQWIKFNRDSIATEEDWETVCELANVDPEEVEAIKLYVIDCDVYYKDEEEEEE